MCIFFKFKFIQKWLAKKCDINILNKKLQNISFKHYFLLKKHILQSDYNPLKIINMSCENMVLPDWNYVFANINIIMHSNFKGIRKILEY
jgi:hypothetical protein